jgi:deoxyribodipyrimidine photo-lyase
MSKQTISIVWLKRDLRLRDHAPIAAAVRAGFPVLICYIFEPSMAQKKDWDIRHWRFAMQSLEDMQSLLSQRALQLYWFHNEVIPAFEKLASLFYIQGIYAHQETGNWASYQRDIAVIKHLKKVQIPFVEFQQAGIIRRLKSRDNWDKKFVQVMEMPLTEIEKGKLQTVFLEKYIYDTLQLEDLPKAIFEKNPLMQTGGESIGLSILSKFLLKNANGYMKNISKPDSSRRNCSRLSPYIAFGNISIRQVYQATNKAIEKAASKRDLQNFLSRVFWQSHFMQKLERQPTYEFQSVNSTFAEVYDATANPVLLAAWENGHTGFPLVDAAMRAVRATGWLNFRLRAMCVSFLTHHLGQTWQSGTPHLARMFLDYEPGIHYSQFQMQAGVTGVNLIRTYNPIKQSYEHDPEGIFIKEWLPELRDIPAGLLHEPWKLNAMEQVFYNCTLGKDYPFPIVEAKQNKTILEKLWTIRKSEAARKEGEKILEVHTQRKDIENRKVLRLPKKTTIIEDDEDE